MLVEGDRRRSGCRAGDGPRALDGSTVGSVRLVLQAFDDGAVFGTIWGTGPPGVVALHGWGRTHRDFDAVFAQPAVSGLPAVVGLDLPGFGASPPPTEPWGSADYAAVVARILATLMRAPKPIVVVGHSLGGRVAVQLAAGHPELVGGLVLTGAPVGPRSSGGRGVAAGYRLARRLHRIGLVGDDAMERARRHYGSADYRAASGVMRQILVRLVAEDYEDVLAQVRCPTELVWGADDTVVPLAVAQAVADRIPGTRLVSCPGVGHLLPTTAPEDLRAGVRRVAGLLELGEAGPS